MESISSRFVKLLLKVMRYKKAYENYDLDINKIRKDNIPIPKKRFYRGCNLSFEKIGSHRIWYLKPDKISNNKVLLYFHGGGYVEEMVKVHWTSIAKIVVSSGLQVIIPEYPLAPESNYKEVHSMIQKTYNKVLDEYKPEDVTFIGDSAGGGLLLSFTMFLRNNDLQLPSKLVALSPWVDVSMTNPEIKEVEKLDPMIAIPGLKRAGEMYAGDLETTNYLVSPLYGEFKDLPPIHIFAGTHDILYPDEKLFAEKAKEAGVDINYYEYPKMIHCWMLLPIKEAKKTIEKIIGLL